MVSGVLITRTYCRERSLQSKWNALIRRIDPDKIDLTCLDPEERQAVSFLVISKQKSRFSGRVFFFSWRITVLHCPPAVTFVLLIVNAKNAARYYTRAR